MRSRIGLVVSLFAAIVGTTIVSVAFVGLPLRATVDPGAIQEIQGFKGTMAFWFPLETHSWSTLADNEAPPTGSNLVLRENGINLGPAHSEHAQIAILGRGRYSHWNNGVYFSSQDGSDPRTNGRIYSYDTRQYPPSWLLVSGIVSILLAAYLQFTLLLVRILPPLSGAVWRGYRRFRPLLISSGITVALLAIVFAVGEIWFRITVPFINRQSEVRFHPDVGFTYEPGSLNRWTNHLDYWSTQRANPLGFLDRTLSEPTQRTGNCHIAIVGDSFVEAVQVPISEKFHVRLEELAKRRVPELQITTAAFGYSGTGQLNQLPFYDHYVRAQKPAVVVLVFVSNDFANNSAILESIRNGWNPEYAPRPFAAHTPDGTLRLTEIHADWQDHLLPVQAQTIAPPLSPPRSWFLHWIRVKLSLLMRGMQSTDAVVVERAAILSRRETYSELFEQWRPTTIAALDSREIIQEELPPILQDAFIYTEFALDEFKRRADEDGVVLLILSTHSMRPPQIDNESLFIRLKKMAERRNIPVIDQTAYIHSLGKNPGDANFRNDGHWNTQGHDWAAGALMQYIEAHPGVCRR